MEVGIGIYLLSYVAGALSTLAPCVLPLLPVLVASALAEHRAGPLALATGLTVSFVAFGLLLASIGLSLGLDERTPRKVAAVLLMVFGAVMVSDRLHRHFTQASARLGDLGNGIIARLHPMSWRGQFAIGLCVGIVWTPCMGPTVATATALAAQEARWGSVTAAMALFGFGASTSLLVLGYLSHQAFQRLRGPVMQAGRTGERLLGALFVVLGMAVVTGFEKRLEAWLLARAPTWLVNLSTLY